MVVVSAELGGGIVPVYMEADGGMLLSESTDDL